MTDLPISIGLEVLRHFEDLGIEYMLVGSVASSLLGIARSTLDLDILARLDDSQGQSFLNRPTANKWPGFGPN